jgi:hypothetical protein
LRLTWLGIDGLFALCAFKAGEGPYAPTGRMEASALLFLNSARDTPPTARTKEGYLGLGKELVIFTTLMELLAGVAVVAPTERVTQVCARPLNI